MTRVVIAVALLTCAAAMPGAAVAQQKASADIRDWARPRGCRGRVRQPVGDPPEYHKSPHATAPAVVI
jgi:hypothetical protein